MRIETHNNSAIFDQDVYFASQDVEKTDNFFIEDI
jgi:hypothetical protein